MTEVAEEIQRKIDAIQAEVHKKREDVDAECNEKLNKLFQERAKSIPSDFWPAVVLNALADDPECMGDYDVKVLQEYLQEFAVELTRTGYSVILKFKPNPYFEEESLTATYEDSSDEPDGTCNFSGITWKEGQGPKDDGSNKSFLELFSVMPPHPDDCSDLDSVDSEEFEEAVEQWTLEVEDRLHLLGAFRHAYTQLSALFDPADDGSAEPASKRQKTESS